MDNLQASSTQIRQRLDGLRRALLKHDLAAWVIPSADPHLSEYLPSRWQGCQWASGFTGSVGTLVVTESFAGLWVDSRYWVQAEAQLAGTDIQLMPIATAASTAHINWLATQLPAGSTVGVDGQVLGLSVAQLLKNTLATHGIALVTQLDLLNDVWADRPALPLTPVFEHDTRYAMQSRVEKLAQIRAEMQAVGAHWHWVSALDDIAWIFNLRGSDVLYNPVFVSHALIGLEQAWLFVAEGKISAALAARLAQDRVELRPYDQAAEVLAALPAADTLLIDPRRITLGLRNAVSAKLPVIESINPSTLFKSRKSREQAQWIRQAMEQDGAALAEFFCWLEAAIEANEPITELTIDEQITAARARRSEFVSPSFATIAGFNANGAMPHYRATQTSHAAIEGNGLLLIDSGAQYQYGTTDITRVVQVRSTTAEQRRDFTLVLKGMINLSRAVFPRGTRSPLLDALARAPLWQAGIDFGHGTGHGVGYFLNVHEGPQGITPHLAPDAWTAMEPGMLTSNEPGIYRPGKWGVRIENLLLNVPALSNEFGEFLKFETMTLCPIDQRCIERALLNNDEIIWLNEYHAEVHKRVSPLLAGDALAWLMQATQPL